MRDVATNQDSEALAINYLAHQAREVAFELNQQATTTFHERSNTKSRTHSCVGAELLGTSTTRRACGLAFDGTERVASRQVFAQLSGRRANERWDARSYLQECRNWNPRRDILRNPTSRKLCEERLRFCLCGICGKRFLQCNDSGEAFVAKQVGPC